VDNEDVIQHSMKAMPADKKKDTTKSRKNSGQGMICMLRSNLSLNMI
jgi:hypothetical protein